MKKIHLFFIFCFVFLFYSEAYAKGSSSSSRSSASSSSRSSSYSSYRSTSTSKNTSGNNYSANKSTWSWNATTVAPNKVKIDTAIKQPVSTKSIVTLKPNPTPQIKTIKETKVVIVKQKTPVAYYKTNPSYHNNSSSDVANAAITAVAITAIANSANADQSPAIVQPVQAIAQPVVYPQQSSNQPIVTKKVEPIIAFDFINDCYKWECD